MKLWDWLRTKHKNDEETEKLGAEHFSLGHRSWKYENN